MRCADSMTVRCCRCRANPVVAHATAPFQNAPLPIADKQGEAMALHIMSACAATHSVDDSPFPRRTRVRSRLVLCAPSLPRTGGGGPALRDWARARGGAAKSVSKSKSAQNGESRTCVRPERRGGFQAGGEEGARVRKGAPRDTWLTIAARDSKDPALEREVIDWIKAKARIAHHVPRGAECADVGARRRATMPTRWRRSSTTASCCASWPTPSSRVSARPAPPRCPSTRQAGTEMWRR